MMVAVIVMTWVAVGRGLSAPGAALTWYRTASRWGDAAKVEVRGEGGWANSTWRGASRHPVALLDGSDRISAYFVSQILLSSSELAEEVAPRVREGAFERLAELSLGETRLGWVSRTGNTTFEEAFPPQARDALFAAERTLQPGHVEIVRSPSGYHVVLVEDVFVEVGAEARAKVPKAGSIEEYCRGRTYAISTMGCQMNAADSERLEGSLRALGLAPSSGEADPDVVVLNTCSIRDHAEQKVYSALGPHAKRKGNTTLVVAGCVAQQEGRRLTRRVPEIDVVMGPQFANRLPELLERAVVWGEQVVATAPSIVTEDANLGVAPRRASEVTAWVNVMHGCNERCAFCVVPTTRGVQQSRTPEAIIAELEDLRARGYKEATLLGQNVDAYGRDLARPIVFADLLERCASRLDDVRLRFATSHPRYMSRRLIQTVATQPNLMPVFHVPAQSGDNGILRLMGRGYTRERYLDLVRQIRELVPDASITSDFIVGCPGETDEAFQNTLDLMRQVEFDACMTAAYSPRPNTPMARFDGSLDAFRTLGIHPTLDAAAVDAAFKQKARQTAAASDDDNNKLAPLLAARSKARRAARSVSEDPLFAFDPLAQIGPPQLDESVKEARLREINDLATLHAKRRSQRYLGRVEPVLVEQANTRRPAQVVGRTPGNRLVFFDGDIQTLKARVVDVKITQANAFSLEGVQI
ncbi:hypothetical protein CTAYLR_009415 [Chrysophaeum taylorii]|uniref:Peptidylprolyl isomerase n=1 Tax=Chrysophaeum taylorii TaxID=2483200 RepID=A0AAD7UKM6_9STRA|nr:hypothetical protein CTAYLR_009415 [Chrysophaeum taylorii]